MADRTLPGLGLKGFWALGESGWKADNDSNLLILSVVLGQSALSVIAADPGAPADGDIHLCSAAHAHPGAIAVRDAGAWVYITVPTGTIMFDVASAYHRYFDGTDWTQLATGTGGGSGTFAATGVVLDGTDDIENAALVATDSPHVVISYWVRYADATARDHAFIHMNDSDNEAGISAYCVNGGADGGKLKVSFEDEDAFNAFNAVCGSDVAPVGVWTHYLIVYRGLARNGVQNELAVYRDRVQLPIAYGLNGTPITPTLNGKNFHVGNGGFSSATDFALAEYYLQTGVDLMEADGSLSSATLDKFITADLKPVDLGADGSTPTGSQPVIYMHRAVGDAAAAFADNLGTGGAFTLTGTLADPVDNPGD